MEELKLWHNIKRGDNKALQELHDKYFHVMCLFASKSINDHQNVENLVSDCFIKIWENRKEIEIKTSIKAYLYRMLRNRVVDYYRKKEEITDSICEFDDNVEDTDFDDSQRYAKLYQAISKLPEQRRRILELAIFESHSFQEIADKLEISKNTVKTQIARAYRFLKESLKPQDFYFFCFFK